MRTSDPDFPVAPAARYRRSTTVTRRTPGLARLKAVLTPLTPPPITTTSAFVMRSMPPCGLGWTADAIVARLTGFREGSINVATHRRGRISQYSNQPNGGAAH